MANNIPGSPFEDDEDEEDIVDRLTSSDAYMFPVIGSAVLGGLFLIIKYFDREWINFLLGLYFSFAGVGSVWKTSISLFRFLVGDNKWRKFEKVNFLVLKRSRELFSISLRTPALWLFVPSLLPSILYSTPWLAQRPALLSNILGVCFAHSALSIFKLDTFRTGCILLAGLFFYDIWWVFGTKVMVSVAKGLDVPIKLAWPKSVDFTTKAGFTILGLGDIVIPGSFITLSLRYDLYRSAKKDWRLPFAKPYFIASLLAYILGLGLTVFVMHKFKAAQPALLYLSPACILSFFITATIKGELGDALQWQDELPVVSIQPESTEELKPKHKGETTNSKDTPDVDLSAAVSSTNDDFVNIERETDDKYVVEADNTRRRKGKKRN